MTSLGSGQQVEKEALRVTAYGTVDELNSYLGVVLAGDTSAYTADLLPGIQNELFNLGSDLSFLEPDKQRYQLPQIEERHIKRLEDVIDELNDIVGPLENFVLPGGTIGAAHLHVARTICRRAERDVATLMREEAVGEHVLAYLNRLSDALFILARFENCDAGVPEPLWDTMA